MVLPTSRLLQPEAHCRRGKGKGGPRVFRRDPHVHGKIQNFDTGYTYMVSLKAHFSLQVSSEQSPILFDTDKKNTPSYEV